MAQKNPSLWLFTNDYKKEEKHPARTGSGEITLDQLKELKAWYDEHKPEDGIIPLQSAQWERVSRNGQPFLFVSFQLKQAKSEGNAEIPNPSGAVKPHSEDEDVPF